MELGWGRENMLTNILLDYNFIHYPRNRLKCGHSKTRERIYLADKAEKGWASNSFLVLQPNIRSKVLL